MTSVERRWGSSAGRQLCSVLERTHMRAESASPVLPQAPVQCGPGRRVEGTTNQLLADM